MRNTTKAALEASLKKLLMNKPLDKITINELTADCGISRMSFYYHFKDIYDLIEWCCTEDAGQALQEMKTYNTWQDGVYLIFQTAMENKPFILNVYRSVSKDKIENYLNRVTYQLLAGVVEEMCADTELPQKYKEFIAGFYKYGFVGVMLDWIERGMKDDYGKIVEMMSIALRGSIANSIHNFERLEDKP